MIDDPNAGLGGQQVSDGQVMEREQVGRVEQKDQLIAAPLIRTSMNAGMNAGLMPANER